MQKFSIPSREEVSENNQLLFENLKKGIGFVPNLYAYFGKNETALGDYLTLQNRKSSLSAKEREIINLTVSQVNKCQYCLSAHTAIAKMNGFSNEEILEIRKGYLSKDTKLNALAKFSYEIAKNRGEISDIHINNFFEVGYTESNLIDVIMVIGDKIISNYIHNITKFDVDFPVVATEVEEESTY